MVRAERSRQLQVTPIHRDRKRPIIFIHGLQGHPRRTWTYVGKREESTLKRGLRNFMSQRLAGGSSQSDDVYWLEDLLAAGIPNARILTYGYDSHVSAFFSGAANQKNIYQYGRNLLNGLEAIRRQNPTRPIIFIVHSLGGIILKDALRRSQAAREEEEDLKDVYHSTFGIVFFGTPHRGSSAASWGLIAKNAALATGFDANDRVLKDLSVDSGILESLWEEFNKMLVDKAFRVVDDASSGLESGSKRKDIINANHIDMCRFNGKADEGYVKVASVLSRYVADICSNSRNQLAAGI
ncbi:hypothetical protein BDD12DRAFT_918067 [Trichophaea hybrida]|nr:hypothetical protein BDD12DRAFT_918067 [Trichophaea hybrida]